MATGKTNAKHFRLFLDEFDMSGDVRTVGSFGVAFAEHEVTGWSDGVMNYTLGHGQVSIEGFQAVFNNTAVTGSYTELKGREEYLAALLMGIRAAPAIGDPCFMSPLEQGQIKISGEGPILMDVSLIGPGTGFTIPSGTGIFGRVLAPKTTFTITTNSTSIDDLASSANGLHAFLHVFTAETVGSWAIKLQHSSNDADWSDLITFTSTGVAVTGEQKTVTGTVNRYLRAQWTYTGGGSTNLSAAMVAARQ